MDRCISIRSALEENKKIRIRSLKTSLENRSLSTSSRLDVLENLAKEYNTWCFDSTIHYLSLASSCAERLGDDTAAHKAQIRTASALASGGYYLEAYAVLREIDTTEFSNKLYEEYYRAYYYLANNLEENSLPMSRSMFGSSRNYLVKSLSYGDSLAGNWKFHRLRTYMLARDYDAADRVADELLSLYEKGSGNYAYTCFYKSVICDSLGRSRDKFLWEIRAAQSDMLCLNKNYAALTMVASSLTVTDPERAFRYIRLSLEDGLFFSGILRTWQSSHFLPEIQASFMQSQLKTKKQTIWINIILFAFVSILICFLSVIWRNYKSLKMLRVDLMKANIVREQYIASFLMRQSDWIDRLRSFQSAIIRKLRFGKTEDVIKELSISDETENEVKIFYRDFDSTFLTLFPTFIDEFNSLLRDECRIDPRSGSDEKMMNTELRIYALVRLGIDDVGEIARLLKKSVRTIYNYRVKVMNATKLDRAAFETAVKGIGKP